MWPKYVILIVLCFCLQFMSLNNLLFWYLVLWLLSLWSLFAFAALCFVFILRGQHPRSISNLFWVMSNISKVDNLVICSLNITGLWNEIKSSKTFNWLREKNTLFFSCKKSTIQKKLKKKLWLAKWGYRGLFSSLSSCRAGVSILFNNNFFFEIQKYFLDPVGRFITVDVKTKDKIITQQNIYAPNNDDPYIST